MGAKRKAPTSPAGTPKSSGKKAKVVDPTEEPLDTISKALKGATGKELPSDVCEMTESIASTALAAPVEERSELHTKYATLVGEALAMATASLGVKAAAAAAALQEADADQTSATATVTAAKQTLTNCETATAAAKKAETEAEDAKDETEDNLAKQEKELGNLDKAKDKTEKSAAELKTALETVTSKEATPKDAKKVIGVLKSIGAADAMLTSVGPALGKYGSEGFEMMILAEAEKVLKVKTAEVNTTLGNWEAHVTNMQTRQATLTQQLEQGKATLEARTKDVKEATDAQKAATIAVKSAEAALKAATRKVSEMTNAKSKADGLVEDAEEAGKAYQFLMARTCVVVEESPASPEASPAKASPAKASPAKASPAKSPPKA